MQRLPTSPVPRIDSSDAGQIAASGLPPTGCKMMTITMFARFVPLAAIAAALLLMPGALTAPAAEADRVDARFEIFGFAGFHVLTNRTTFQEMGDRYAIAMELDTRGLASVFVDLTSHSEVRGGVNKATPHPEPYRADRPRTGVER